MSTKNEVKNEELEQYGHRLCLQIDRVPVEKGETIETMCDEANLDNLACCHRRCKLYWK